jgi:hypothetical protein
MFIDKTQISLKDWHPPAFQISQRGYLNKVFNIEGYGMEYSTEEMEQHALKTVNNCLNIKIYFYSETPVANVIKLFTAVSYDFS